jgi:hypothetical protein
VACVAHDGQARRCHTHIHGAAFKQLHTQLLFQVFDGNGQGGLRHTTGLRCMAKVLFLGQRNNVFERRQIHLAWPFNKKPPEVWAPGVV